MDQRETLLPHFFAQGRCNLLLLAVVAFLLLYSSVSFSEFDDNSAFHCARDNASFRYQSKGVAGRGELDLCLQSLTQVLPQLSSFTVVDVRAKGVSDKDPITNTQAVPAAFLKTKSHLTDKKLLLVGGGFSRARVSAVCAELKTLGFESVSALSGGVESLLSDPSGRFLSVQTQRERQVSAQQLVEELQRGRVVMVVKPSDEDEVRSLGLNIYHLSDKSSVLPVTAIEASGGGYYPIVLLGHADGLQNSEAINRYQNIYYLDGGVESLQRFQQELRLINQNRTGTPNRFGCGSG